MAAPKRKMTPAQVKKAANEALKILSNDAKFAIGQKLTSTETTIPKIPRAKVTTPDTMESDLSFSAFASQVDLSADKEQSKRLSEAVTEVTTDQVADNLSVKIGKEPQASGMEADATRDTTPTIFSKPLEVLKPSELEGPKPLPETPIAAVTEAVTTAMPLDLEEDQGVQAAPQDEPFIIGEEEPVDEGPQEPSGPPQPGAPIDIGPTPFSMLNQQMAGVKGSAIEQATGADFNQWQQLSQEGMESEDQSDSLEQFNEHSVAIIERLAGQVANLTMRLRLVEDLLDRIGAD